MDKLNRRDALKIMGAGISGVAIASVTSPLASAKERVDDARIAAGFTNINPLDFKPADDEPVYSEKLVYKGEDVSFRQIDEHTWHGNGHLCYNESIYIIEGKKHALVIDAGTKIPGLSKIVAGITSKHVILVATHVHPDHTGSAINEFPEIWINAGDTPSVPSMMRSYEGKINYLSDGQVFDLGGREIEVLFTPGHTPGSASFFDKEKGYGFSGDAFGSTNLLLSTNFSTLVATTERTAWYMQRHGIKFMYPGHYSGDNLETLKRVLDERDMAKEMLDGKRKGEKGQGMLNGLNSYIQGDGITIRYNDPKAIK